MKIGIKINLQIITLPFFINLAKYLELQGHEVLFINPNFYVEYILKKYNIKFLKYENKEVENKLRINKNDKIFKYYSETYKLKSKKDILKELNLKLNLAYQNLKEQKFDYILFWNGISDVETNLSEKLKFKTYFFENGYLDNYLQMDYYGVNYDTSFSKLSLKELYNFKYKENNKLKKIRYEIIPVKINYPTISVIYLIKKKPIEFIHDIFRIFNFYYYPFKFKKTKEIDPKLINKIDNYIFFPLQVNSDTQIKFNSKYFNHMEEILNKIKSEKIKENFIIKEHPFEVNKTDYNKINYNYFNFIKKYDLKKLISKSKLVVVVNSSVGFQSIIYNKPILLLGNSFYENAPNITKYNPKLSFKENIDNALKKEINPKDLKKYINKFKKDIFIKGNWRKPNIELIEKVSKRII